MPNFRIVAMGCNRFRDAEQHLVMVSRLRTLNDILRHAASIPNRPAYLNAALNGRSRSHT